MNKKSWIMVIFLIAGLTVVSLIKNETRSVQKEIKELRLIVYEMNKKLHEAKLDYEVLSSPENISFLAKEYLDKEIKSYSLSQIEEPKSTPQPDNKNLISKDPEVTPEKPKIEKDKKIKRWFVWQVAKVFLGVPVGPIK